RSPRPSAARDPVSSSPSCCSRPASPINPNPPPARCSKRRRVRTGPASESSVRPLGDGPEVDGFPFMVGLSFRFLRNIDELTGTEQRLAEVDHRTMARVGSPRPLVGGTLADQEVGRELDFGGGGVTAEGELIRAANSLGAWLALVVGTE